MIFVYVVDMYVSPQVESCFRRETDRADSAMSSAKQSHDIKREAKVENTRGGARSLRAISFVGKKNRGLLFLIFNYLGTLWG